MKKLLLYITQKIDYPILHFSALSGGDISAIYLLETSYQKFVLKTNKSPQALAMFQAEQVGLTAIAATATIKTPTIYLCETHQNIAFLLMEYVPSKKPSEKDFERLGYALGQLHQATNHTFGWQEDNFIGSLNQSNTNHNSWLDFYIKERLHPQFQLALKTQLLTKKEIPTQESLFQKGTPLFKDIQPVLLHGDLWSGNYLIAKNGIPYLIDSATYYGHSEVDIAMTRLFGGFGQAFYDAYHELHPLQTTSAIRQDWYQLYYLLVHLNLFGRGYYRQVKRVLARCF